MSGRAREVPPAPGSLLLSIERRWDGGAPRAASPPAWLRLTAASDGLLVAAGMAHTPRSRIPDAPAGARVDRLWESDVVECFLVAADGRYLELELGAGGHYLAFAFSAPRRRSSDLEAPQLAVAWERDDRGWTSRCALPRVWVPEPVVRANAFANAGGELLAHHPTGGEHPDFHRPGAFPPVRIPSWEVR